MGKAQIVKIPLERFEELISLEANVSLLMEYTQEQRYSVEREKVAHYLNFKLREHKPTEKVLPLGGMLGEGNENAKCDHGKETEGGD